MFELVQHMENVAHGVYEKNQELKNAETKEQKDKFSEEINFLFKKTKEIRNKVTTTDSEIHNLHQEIINCISDIKDVVKKNKRLNSFFHKFYLSLSIKKKQPLSYIEI